jgi:hypothetical protein
VNPYSTKLEPRVSTEKVRKLINHLVILSDSTDTTLEEISKYYDFVSRNTQIETLFKNDILEKLFKNYKRPPTTLIGKRFASQKVFRSTGPKSSSGQTEVDWPELRINLEVDLNQVLSNYPWREQFSETQIEVFVQAIVKLKKTWSRTLKTSPTGPTFGQVLTEKLSAALKRDFKQDKVERALDNVSLEDGSAVEVDSTLHNNLFSERQAKALAEELKDYVNTSGNVAETRWIGTKKGPVLYKEGEYLRFVERAICFEVRSEIFFPSYSEKVMLVLSLTHSS